ncbi:Ras-related protein RabC [Glycine soja]
MESQTDLQNRPGIFIIGSSNVGKRTLLSRLTSVDVDDAFDSASQVNAHGWTINNKYYTADVSLWMAHLHDDFSAANVTLFRRMTALVMVFDMNEPSSLAALREWVSRTDIQNFEILLCIGNKVDLVPSHPAHAEYRRRLLKLEDSAADFYSEEYGISESEGTSLLGDEEPSWDIRRSCLDWCTDHNIEFIEACASNADFDKCLSIDGDLQGVERLYGALSAHMWPGMVLKSGNRINQLSFPEKEELSSEESDYEQEYEVLSAGSADWDESEHGWISASSLDSGGSAPQNNPGTVGQHEDGIKSDKESHPTTSSTAIQDESEKDMVHNTMDSEGDGKENEGKCLELEDLEHLMSEIGNMRAGLRLMPDFQRRDMAAKLAMKMASIFGGESDEEEI